MCQGSGSPAGQYPNRNRVILSPKGTRLGPCCLALRNAACAHGAAEASSRAAPDTATESRAATSEFAALDTV